MPSAEDQTTKAISFTKKSPGALYLAKEFEVYNRDPSKGISYWSVTTDDINKIYESNLSIFGQYSKKQFPKNFISHANDFHISAIKAGARKGSKF